MLSLKLEKLLLVKHLVQLQQVLVDDIDDNKRLFVTSQTRFIIGEIVSGSSSNASGTITNI